MNWLVCKHHDTVQKPVYDLNDRVKDRAYTDSFTNFNDQSGSWSLYFLYRYHQCIYQFKQYVIAIVQFDVIKACTVICKRYLRNIAWSVQQLEFGSSTFVILYIFGPICPDQLTDFATQRVFTYIRNLISSIITIWCFGLICSDLSRL